jgi:hypothetical protein
MRLRDAVREASRPDGLTLIVGGSGASARLAKSLAARLAPPHLPEAVSALRMLAV